MSQSFYPTTLFHFTEELETLYSILDSSNFKISFAREFIQGPTTNRNSGIPMVSFCDIRLTQLTQHTESYGHYGIGLSKKWANSHGLNPVIYMSKSSVVFDHYNIELRKIKKNLVKKKNTLEDIKLTGAVNQINTAKRKYDSDYMDYRKIIDPLRYMKNYQATLKRRDKPDQQNYIFADEREWRYVPDIEGSLGKPIIAAANNISTPEGKRKYNSYYDGDRLGFTEGDIMYIIVRYESDVMKMMNYLSLKYGIKSKVIPRILSMELISNDM